MFVVSFKALQKARQMAKRTRAAIACARCKDAKMRCSDSRPCKRCIKSRTPCIEKRAKTKIASPEQNIRSEPVNHLLDTPGGCKFLDAACSIREENCDPNLPNYGLQGTYTSDMASTNGPTLPSINAQPALISHGYDLNRVGPSSYEPFVADFGRPQVQYMPPHSAQPNPMMASSLLPHAVAALLCDLTRPVPHPPPPPYALGMLLAMAGGIAPPSEHPGVG